MTQPGHMAGASNSQCL